MASQLWWWYLVLRSGGVIICILVLVSDLSFMKFHPIKEGAETPSHCATTHHESIEGGDTRLDVLRIQLDFSMAAQVANRTASKLFCLSSCHA